MTKVQAWITDEVDARVRDYAATRGVSYSQAVRDLLSLATADLGPDECPACGRVIPADPKDRPRAAGSPTLSRVT